MNILGCVEMWICDIVPLQNKKNAFFWFFFAKKFAKPKMFDVSLHRILKEASIEPMFHTHPVPDHYGGNTGAIRYIEHFFSKKLVPLLHICIFCCTFAVVYE